MQENFYKAQKLKCVIKCRHANGEKVAVTILKIQAVTLSASSDITKYTKINWELYLKL